jgi:hypothetical protein
MTGNDAGAKVLLDLNDAGFQEDLFALQKPERHAAMDTLNKIRQLTWAQVYRDSGLKWEKISTIRPPQGIDAVYSLRVTRSCRATAYRDGQTMCLLTVDPDHDAAYGRK